jgi:2,5-furandicarboxylate decarboxylase 1
VVDADIDPYNEEQVLWAIATRVQADRDVDVIRICKGNTLDPSQEDDVMSAKMIIDATKPVSRPYEERVRVPAAALERIDLDAYLAPQAARAAPR